MNTMYLTTTNSDPSELRLAIVIERESNLNTLTAGPCIGSRFSWIPIIFIFEKIVWWEDARYHGVLEKLEASLGYTFSEAG